MKRKPIENLYEQVFLGVIFYKTNNLGNPSYFESFGTNFVGDSVEKNLFTRIDPVLFQNYRKNSC